MLVQVSLRWKWFDGSLHPISCRRFLVDSEDGSRGRKGVGGITE